MIYGAVATIAPSRRGLKYNGSFVLGVPGAVSQRLPLREGD